MAAQNQNTVLTRNMTCAFWFSYGHCNRGLACKYAHYHIEGMVVADLPGRDPRTGISLAGRNLADAYAQQELGAQVAVQPQPQPQPQLQPAAPIFEPRAVVQAREQAAAAAAAAREETKKREEREKWDWEHYAYIHRANQEYLERMEKERQAKRSRWAELFEQQTADQKRQRWMEEAEKEIAGRRQRWARETEKVRLRGIQERTGEMGRRIWEYRVLTPSRAVQAHVQTREEDVVAPSTSPSASSSASSTRATINSSRSPSPSTSPISSVSSSSWLPISGRSAPRSGPKIPSQPPKLAIQSTSRKPAPYYIGRHRLTIDVMNEAAAELRHIPHWTEEFFAERCWVIMERRAMLSGMVDDLVRDEEEDAGVALV